MSLHFFRACITILIQPNGWISLGIATSKNELPRDNYYALSIEALGGSQVAVDLTFAAFTVCNHIGLMSSKSAIISSINAQTIPPVDLPPDVARPIRYEDPLQQFSEVLQMIGGQAIHVASLADTQRLITEQEIVQTAQQIVSVVPGIEVNSAKRIDLAAIADPHDLERVDVSIMRGEFAVAENGAVWCTDELLKHRIVYFLSQHLILLVPAQQIVHNMHEAYERLQFTGSGFGMFKAGPSKTADIEQSLVIGAHGARSLTVYLVDEFK